MLTMTIVLMPDNYAGHYDISFSEMINWKAVWYCSYFSWLATAPEFLTDDSASRLPRGILIPNPKLMQSFFFLMLGRNTEIIVALKWIRFAFIFDPNFTIFLFHQKQQLFPLTNCSQVNWRWGRDVRSYWAWYLGVWYVTLSSRW